MHGTGGPCRSEVRGQRYLLSYSILYPPWVEGSKLCVTHLLSLVNERYYPYILIYHLETEKEVEAPYLDMVAKTVKSNI